MKRVTSIILLALASCSQTKAPDQNVVLNVSNEADAVVAQASRWQIEIWDSPSITGSPETNNIYVPNAREVLQQIVVSCRLGKSWLSDGTDGVMMLSIVNSQLTADQIKCVRAAERPGLILKDQKSAS